MRKGGKVSDLGVAPSEAPVDVCVSSVWEPVSRAKRPPRGSDAPRLGRSGGSGCRGSIKRSPDGGASQGRRSNTLLCVRSSPALSLRFPSRARHVYSLT